MEIDTEIIKDRNCKKSIQLLDLLDSENRFKRVEECGRVFFRNQKSFSRGNESVVNSNWFAGAASQANNHFTLDIIHRITMFLTFRCNLRCFYCNTITPFPGQSWPAQGKEYDLTQFINFIDGLKLNNIRHLHLTGGEVTLIKELPDMIKYASSLGIPCSITTNGTAPAEFYQKLVESGLKEVRISIDTTDPVQFDENVGRKGAFYKVIKTIKKLVSMRDDKGSLIYIILNTCVGVQNLRTLPGNLRKLLLLKPDDIKLIGISYERKILKQQNQSLEVIHEIEDNLNKTGKNFPLLRKKLKIIFSQDTYGLEDLASQRLMNNCFVPLTERTVDAEYYYPCPVYVREGGKPFGKLAEDDFSVQRQKINSFVKGNSCIDDPVCQRACLYCTKVFNNHMNAAVHKKIKRDSGKFEPITKQFSYEGNISSDRIISTIKKIDSQRNKYIKDVPYHPYLIIKPNGMNHKKKILAMLNKKKIGVKESKKIIEWNNTALELYCFPPTIWNIYRGLLFARVLPEIEGRSDAEILMLDDSLSIDKLKEIKYWIRNQLPLENYLIFHQDEIIITTPGYLHSPDQDTYWLDYNILQGVLS